MLPRLKQGATTSRDFFLGGKRGEKKDSLLLGLNVSFQKLVGVKSLTFLAVFLVGVEL